MGAQKHAAALILNPDYRTPRKRNMAAVSKALAKPGQSLAIGNVGELMELANILFKGRAASLPNVDRPEKVFSILLAGMEVGLAPNQALDSIMLNKNGRLSIWGDGALALVRASGLLESIKEWVDGSGDEETGHCQAKRKGEEEKHYTFSVADANRAGLIERARGKNGDGPWVTYRPRMLVMRARGWLLRDVFPDVLRGLITTEEALDYADAEVKVVSVKSDAPALPAARTEPATTPAAVSDGITGPVLPEQLSRLAELRQTLLAGKGIGPSDALAAKSEWEQVLAPYGTTSAKQLTASQAAELIEQLGKQHDPFSHPNSGDSKT